MMEKLEKKTAEDNHLYTIRVSRPPLVMINILSYLRPFLMKGNIYRALC